jgi:hypothetical protein
MIVFFIIIIFVIVILVIIFMVVSGAHKNKTPTSPYFPAANRTFACPPWASLALPAPAAAPATAGDPSPPAATVPSLLHCAFVLERQAVGNTVAAKTGCHGSCARHAHG